MGEWIAIAQWERCVEMARDGIVFEIRNADGNIMTTQCVQPLPDRAVRLEIAGNRVPGRDGNPAATFDADPAAKRLRRTFGGSGVIPGCSSSLSTNC